MEPAAPRLRLFVAIDLPPAWREYLAARARDIERLAPGYARWVAPELLHLTVVFLGEQPAERLAVIQEAVASAAAAVPAFTLALGGLGAFGTPAPRVLWVEARPSGNGLQRLHAALQAELQARAVPFDAKPLVPHLTLGRARREASTAAGRALAERLPRLALPPPPQPFRVAEVALMRSELSSRGPRYTSLARYPLA